MTQKRRATQTKTSWSTMFFGEMQPPKKRVKRDQNWRKMTQKRAIHAKNPAKQPERYISTNHERHIMRRLVREANK